MLHGVVFDTQQVACAVGDQYRKGGGKGGHQGGQQPTFSFRPIGLRGSFLLVTQPYLRFKQVVIQRFTSFAFVRGGLLGQLQQVRSAVGTGVGAVQGIVHGWVISVEN